MSRGKGRMAAFMMSVVIMIGIMGLGSLTARAEEIIVDDQDTGFTKNDTLTGWNTSNTGYGINNNHTRTSVLQSGAWGRWTPTLSEGLYSVWVYMPRVAATNDPVHKYDIYHNGSVDSHTLNFSVLTVDWYEIGIYYFDGTGNEYVELIRTTADNTKPTRMDAVKFVKMDLGNVTSHMQTLVNKKVSGQIQASSPGINVTYTLSTIASHGTVTLNSSNGSWEYTPNAGYLGTDSFAVTVTKTADGTTALATESISVIDYQTYIIDYGDTAYSENSGWTDSSTSVKGYNDSRARYCQLTDGAWVKWSPNVVAGMYDVSVYKIYNTSNNDPCQVYTIRHNGVTDIRYLDFTKGSSGWVELGNFYFDGKGDEYVQLTKSGNVYNTRADAVKFAGVPEGFTIDNPVFYNQDQTKQLTSFADAAQQSINYFVIDTRVSHSINSSASKDVTLVSALYSITGVLKATSVDKKVLNKGDIVHMQTPIDLQNLYTEGDYIKVFVWDSMEKMAPYKTAFPFN